MEHTVKSKKSESLNIHAIYHKFLDEWNYSRPLATRYKTSTIARCFTPQAILKADHRPDFKCTKYTPDKVLSLCMMTSSFSALLAICAGNSPVTGEFPTQRPVRRSFDVFFDLCLNKQLSTQSRGWWFETLSRPLWRHCNGNHDLNPPITNGQKGCGLPFDPF